MKNALILHGTGSFPLDNWFPWLKEELQKLGYAVWIPQLPKSLRPNIKRYNKFLLSENFDLNKETIIIGHSSGAVAILGLLEVLPENVKVNSVYLVASFKDSLGNKNLDGLFTNPFDFKLIKARSRKFIYFHSDDDPYCPLSHAKYLNKHTGGELVLIPGQKHFSIYTSGLKYRKFPELLLKIKQTT